MPTIKLDRLERYVEALKSVVADFPEVDMHSLENPECGTPGCHAGLARMALKRCGVKRGKWVDFSDEADALARYLFRLPRATRITLDDWAGKNADLWGGGYGMFMFSSKHAFGQATNCFPSSVIAEHWAGVLERARGAEVSV
jgi:hypothetical protein